VLRNCLPSENRCTNNDVIIIILPEQVLATVNLKYDKATAELKCAPETL
jgi:hypothetical protein